MNSPSVAIVILNYNGIEDTNVCLRSFKVETYPNYELVVVDNHSTDDSVDKIRSEFPQVKLITNSSNLGFCGGNNVGIHYAIEQEFDYIMLLNNDTLIQWPFVQFLVDALEEDQTLGAVSPLIYFGPPTEEIWFGGARINYKRALAFHDNSQFQGQTSPYGVEWLTGCAPFVRSQILKELDGFDERYFLYWEDADISLRIRGKGYNLAIEPKAKINHLCGRSTNKLRHQARYYFIRNHMIFAKTHMSDYRGAVLMTFLRNAKMSLGQVIAHMKLSEFADAFQVFRCTLLAFFDFFRHRYGKRTI